MVGMRENNKWGWRKETAHVLHVHVQVYIHVLVLVFDIHVHVT